MNYKCTKFQWVWVILGKYLKKLETVYVAKLYMYFFLVEILVINTLVLGIYQAPYGLRTESVLKYNMHAYK